MSWFRRRTARGSRAATARGPSGSGNRSGEGHTSIVRKTPGLTRWIQNYVGTLPSEAAPDGIGELWFASAAAMESAEMAAAVEDARRFLDMEPGYAVVVVERRVLG